MNQILCTNKSKKYSKRLAIIQFVSLFVIFFCLVLCFGFERIIRLEQIKNSKLAIKTNKLNQLYKSNNKSFIFNNQIIPILGTISIPKLDLSYPVFSICSDELLKISICRFYGPSTYANGNICIAGHNYNNNLFFSNLFMLEIGDEILINFVNSSEIKYKVYQIFETSPNNTKYMSQETNRLL